MCRQWWRSWRQSFVSWVGTTTSIIASNLPFFVYSHIIDNLHWKSDVFDSVGSKLGIWLKKMATELERRELGCWTWPTNIFGLQNIALFFIISYWTWDQKFWPPNSHSISTKLGLKGLGFRVAKKAYQNHFKKFTKKLVFQILIKIIELDKNIGFPPNKYSSKPLKLSEMLGRFSKYH